MSYTTYLCAYIAMFMGMGILCYFATEIYLQRLKIISYIMYYTG